MELHEGLQEACSIIWEIIPPGYIGQILQEAATSDRANYREIPVGFPLLWMPSPHHRYAGIQESESLDDDPVEEELTGEATGTTQPEQVELFKAEDGEGRVIQIKGKRRMVFDYRALNDNTHKDQYSLPGIESLKLRIGRSKLYSKYDLKSGFHQIAMDEESVPWTAFLVPGGLYEWLVMPFGLKNAPAAFQRKMDHCFAGMEKFTAVYVDDILVKL